MSRGNSSVVNVSGVDFDLNEGTLALGSVGDRSQFCQHIAESQSNSGKGMLFIDTGQTFPNDGLVEDEIVIRRGETSYGLDIMNPSNEEDAKLYADTLYGYIEGSGVSNYFDVLHVLVIALLDDSNTSLSDIQERFRKSGIEERDKVIAALDELAEDSDLHGFFFGSADTILTPESVRDMYERGSTIVVSDGSESGYLSGLGLYYFWQCLHMSDLEDSQASVVVDGIERVNRDRGILKGLPSMTDVNSGQFVGSLSDDSKMDGSVLDLMYDSASNLIVIGDEKDVPESVSDKVTRI